MRGDATIARIYATGRVAERDGSTAGVWNEGPDGWWAALKPGWSWCDAEVHCCHEDTLTELLRAVRNTTPCEPGCSCGHGGER